MRKAPPKRSERPPNKPRKKAQSPEIGAKAEAVVKVEASYQRTRTHNITEHVPEDVSRAKSEAWLDVFSPVREWLGLKGDILRHRREQLSLQRHETLAEIGRRVNKLIPAGAVVPELPPKFLVPYVEQASLEEPDSPLVELWANLLASALEDFDGQFLHFSRIISGLSPRQAEIFKQNFTAADLYLMELASDDVATFYQQSMVRRIFGTEFKHKNPKNTDEIAECIIEFLDNAAVHVIHASFKAKTEIAEVVFPYPILDDKDRVDYSILEAIGLISLVSPEFMDFSGARSVSLTYYHLTPLGNAFAEACKIRPAGSQPVGFTSRRKVTAKQRT